MGNIEVYEGKVLKEAKEAKEKLIKEFKYLCIDYHEKHDKSAKGWSIDNYRTDYSLLRNFESMRSKVKMLPKPLQSVYWHRYAYLNAMASLGRNERIRNFVSFMQRRFGPDRVQYSKAELEQIRDEKVFKALQPGDFNKATQILGASLSYISWMDSSGAWVGKAQKYLEGDRVDDHTASRRLRSSFAHLVKNIPKLESLHT